MTNEQVREQYEEIQRELGFDCKVFKYMGEINEIQNLTRKAEREKVIEEIKKEVNKYMYHNTTDNSEKVINRHYRNILDVLNHLKNDPES